jgi:drug/metabolite transporter (DMT)-like permease
MLCGCFAFAWMGTFAHRLGVLECDWRIIALARSLLAFLFALGLARLAGARLVLWRPGMLWLRSCAGSLSLLCTFFALSWMAPSEVLTLTSTFPIWVALLSWPLLHERPSAATWVAACCGVLGVYLIQQPAGDASIPSHRFATLLALVAAFTSAVAMLGLHRLKELDTWAIVVHFSGVSTAFVLCSWFFGQAPPVEQALDGQLALLLVGVGITATVGQLCLTRAFTSGQPARVSVVNLTQILFALVLDALFADLTFHPTKLAGIGLVVAPTAWMMAARAET